MYNITCTDLSKDTLNIFAVNIFFACSVLPDSSLSLPDLFPQEAEKIIIRQYRLYRKKQIFFQFFSVPFFLLKSERMCVILFGVQYFFIICILASTA